MSGQNEGVVPGASYLGAGLSLQGREHHYVSLHAHQELGDGGGHGAVPRGPQGPQELAPPHAVHDDGAVLRAGTENTRLPSLSEDHAQRVTLPL